MKQKVNVPDQPPEDKDGLLELLKKLWLPVAGFLGAVTLAYNFYQLWLGDQETVTIITAGTGLIVLVIVLGWVGFGSRTITREAVWPIGAKITEKIPIYPPLHRRLSRVALLVVFAGMSVGAVSLVRHWQTLEEKLVVLIAAFEGPEEVYGLRNEIIESLNADFSDDQEIEIVIVDDIITLTQGSEYARKLGKRRLADIVVWGWYRPTENPNITIHIENLTPNQLSTLKESTTVQLVTTLAELESFIFQQQAGQETSILIYFLAGYVEYQDKDYETALKRFDEALADLSVAPRLLENWEKIHFYRGNANSFLRKYQSAILDYDHAIQINPQLATAYSNRGVAYAFSGEYQDAIRDLDHAVQINPQLVDAYINRGNTYAELGDYQQAIRDYTQAIQINPQDADVDVYNNRGNVYAGLGEYQRAIQDYTQAIQINPQFALAYNNRGATYAELGEYQLAIQDFDQIIQLNPESADAYSNRGNVHLTLGDYQHAIQDYTRAIQINPQLAQDYLNRGVSYQRLGQTAEAEADFKKYDELIGQKP